CDCCCPHRSAGIFTQLRWEIHGFSNRRFSGVFLFLGLCGSALAAPVFYGVFVVSRVILLFSLLLPTLSHACPTCFSDSPFHFGLVLGTLMLIPLPILIAWGIYQAAKTAEKESRPD